MVGRAHLEDRFRPMAKDRREYACGEVPGGRALILRLTIGLVEHDDEVTHGPREDLNKRQLFARDRRVGAEYHKRGVDVRDKVPRRFGVGDDNRTETRGIDETKTGCQEPARDEDFDRPDALLVAGVVLLRDVGRQRARIAFLPVSVAKADTRAERAPCRKMVTAQVIGTTPVGRTVSSTRPFISVDFPRLN